MGCLVDANILNPDKTLTQAAKDNFIKEVKEIIVYGSAAAPTPSLFPCGEEIPPTPGATFENINLEDESIYGSFHRDILKNKYEKFAVALDAESTHSLLPLFADPMALAGKFGVDLKPPAFPDGFIPYFTGLLVPKLSLDLFDAGVPDYIFPPALIAKLPEFISIPQPPALPPLPAVLPPPIPGVTPPPLPSVPAPEFPDIPQPLNLSAPPLPQAVPPELALGELLAVDANMIATIPKLLAELIADIPKLILKLGDLPALFSDICKKVSESGIFGEEKENEKIKKIYNRVLSKKLSSCLFTAALASTIGSGKGSVSSAVSEKATNVPAAKPNPPTKASVLSWQQRIIDKANSMNGLSYGKDQQTYLENVFYMEYTTSFFENQKVSVYGKPVSPASLPSKNDYPYLEDLVAAFSRNEQNAKTANLYGVEDSSSFLKYAAAVGKTDSSCALFARSCLLTAGASNEFFISHYPPASAIAGLKALAIIKNYDWLIPPETNSEIAVTDQPKTDLVANTELADYAATFEQRFLTAQTELAKSNALINVLGQWSLNKDGKPASSNEILHKYVKKKIEDLACYPDTFLSEFAERGEKLPLLEVGDILIVKTPGSGVKKEGAPDPQVKFDDTHIMVVVKAPPTRINFINRRDGKKPTDYEIDSFSVVEGGLEDFNNRGPIVSKANSLRSEAAYEEYQKLQKDSAASPSDEGLKNALKKYAGAAFQVEDKVFVVSEDGTFAKDETETFLLRYPTAIARSSFEYGYIVNDSKPTENGYFLSKKSVKNNKPIPFRRIEMLIKTRNFLSIEILRKDASPELTTECNIALLMQDEHPVMKRVMSLLYSSERLAVLMPFAYPSWSHRPPWPR